MFNYEHNAQVYKLVPTDEYTITMNVDIPEDAHRAIRVCVISEDERLVKVVETRRSGNTVEFELDTAGQIVVISDEDPMYILTYQLKGGGQGTMVGGMYYPGEACVLEECELIPDEGFRFKCWEIDGVYYNVGDTIIVNKETYVYTVWERIPSEEHIHDFVDGKCEYGNWDPDYTPEIPEIPEDPEKPEDPENPEDPESPETPEEPEEKDHSKCLEEASGWKRFWNAIGNFFRRIFSKYVKCVCGDKVPEEDYTEFKKIFKDNK